MALLPWPQARREGVYFGGARGRAKERRNRGKDRPQMTVVNARFAPIAVVCVSRRVAPGLSVRMLAHSRGCITRGSSPVVLEFTAYNFSFQFVM